MLADSSSVYAIGSADPTYDETYDETYHLGRNSTPTRESIAQKRAIEQRWLWEEQVRSPLATIHLILTVCRPWHEITTAVL